MLGVVPWNTCRNKVPFVTVVTFRPWITAKTADFKFYFPMKNLPFLSAEAGPPQAPEFSTTRGRKFMLLVLAELGSAKVHSW